MRYNTYDCIPLMIGYSCGGCYNVCYDYNMRKQINFDVSSVGVVKKIKGIIKRKNKKELEYRYSRMLIQKYDSSFVSDI